jgi:tRNA uridine 5-carboxymethylaminomethyl modification enzyme
VLTTEHLNPDRQTRATVRSITGVEINSPTTWGNLLRRADVDAERAAAGLAVLNELDADDLEIVLGLLRYEGYGARAERERQRVQRLREARIPSDLDPASIPGLSRQVAEEMVRVRPRTLAEAERLPGMTPAAVSILAGKIARAARVRGGGE